MKKFLAMILASSMMLSLMACGSTSTSGTAQTTEAAAETPAATEAAETEAAEIKAEAAEAETEAPAAETEAAKEEEAAAPFVQPEVPEADHVIVLDGNKATIDGEAVKEYDYTWHTDPAGTYEEVKNAPGEYFTGTEPSGEEAVYVAHDIYYYPEIDPLLFRKVRYDGETEWVTYYTSEEYGDYIYSTLPLSNGQVPTQMMHSEEEAAKNAKLHITAPGTYEITGTWNGQIWIDLGEEAFDDPNAKVNILLNNANVTCTVAPAIVFYSVYECDNTWEDREEYTKIVDTADAGANVFILDGTENYFSGTNIFRMLKTKLKDEDSKDPVPVQKKIRKTDGAFYSYMSMNINGDKENTGLLDITGGFEGLDSELHLTLNGGRITVKSQDDGININEDGVSVLTVNGGDIRVLGGLGAEGDGVDSNGFITVNGGTIIAMAHPAMDSGLDSDGGSYVFGGTVVALGSTMDWAESDDSNDKGSVTMNLRFSEYEDASEDITIYDESGNVVFRYCQTEDEALSDNIRQYSGAIISFPELTIGETYTVSVAGKQQSYTSTDALRGPGFGGFGPGPDFNGERPEMPEGMEFPDDMEFPEGMEFSKEFELPDGTEFSFSMEWKEGEMPEMPEGMEMPPEWNGDGKDDGKKPEGDRKEGGERPERPEGGKDGERPGMPEGGFPGGMPGFGGQGEEGEASTLFYMADRVNSFSGVSDAE